MADFAKLFKSHQEHRGRRVAKAYVKALKRGKEYIVAHTLPIAFRELEHSFEVYALGTNGAELIVSAPHAAAVENGSRPHWVPIEPLIAWVKLRGMQGLTRSGRGSTTAMHAKSIRAELKSMQQGPRGGKYNLVDDANDVARRIQYAIAHVGTKPSHYVLRAMTTIDLYLHEEIEEAISTEHGIGQGIG